MIRARADLGGAGKGGRGKKSAPGIGKDLSQLQEEQGYVFFITSLAI
jgi:hypothetical protein